MQTFDNPINTSLNVDNFFLIKENIDINAVLENIRLGTANWYTLKGLDFESIKFEQSAILLRDPVFLNHFFKSYKSYF
jgi:hypothetical protein